MNETIIRASVKISFPSKGTVYGGNIERTWLSRSTFLFSGDVHLCISIRYLTFFAITIYFGRQLMVEISVNGRDYPLISDTSSRVGESFHE